MTKHFLLIILFFCIAWRSFAQDETFFVVEEMPQPKEGMDGFFEYIEQNIQYPKAERKMGIEGKVFVQFVVQKDGSLANVKIVKGLTEPFEQEALRVLKDYPKKWLAGKQRGKAVSVRMTLPISFSLKNQKESLPLVIVKRQPTPKEDLKGFYKYIAKSLKYPKTARKAGVQGKVFVQFVVEKSGKLSQIKVIKGIHPECDAEAVRVLRDYPDTWLPGMKDGKAVEVTMTLPIAFRLKTESIETTQTPLLVIDGEVLERSEAKVRLAQIQPHSITKVDILKGEEAIDRYGSKAQYGVIIITSKEEAKAEVSESLELTVFPNPSKSKTSVSFELDSPSAVKIEMYSIRNPKPQAILDRKLSKGKYSFNINTSAYADGVYILKITHQENVTYKKLLIEK